MNIFLHIIIQLTSVLLTSVIIIYVLRKEVVKLVARYSHISPTENQEDLATGLLNYASIKGFIIKSVEKAKESKNYIPITIMLVDIDRFKDVNTKYGMEIGDRLINAIAKLLQSNIRGSNDGLFRYKIGDEFLIVLYDTPSEIAFERVAPRLSKTISDKEFYLQENSIPLTGIKVSIAVTNYDYTSEDFPQVDHRLLHAMKRAKETEKIQLIS